MSEIYQPILEQFAPKKRQAQLILLEAVKTDNKNLWRRFAELNLEYKRVVNQACLERGIEPYF